MRISDWSSDVCSSDLDQPGDRVADERPLLEVRSALPGDAPHLGAEAGDGDGEDRAQDQGVLRLRLDPDAVRLVHVAAADRPATARAQGESGVDADRWAEVGRAACWERWC